jgi:hypothetical protein
MMDVEIPDAVMDVEILVVSIMISVKS